MIVNSIEPFIILPFGYKQEIVFWSKTSLKNELSSMIDIAYCELPNTIIKDNLIKVVCSINYIIVLHIYPTNVKEKGSGRLGQNLIIGYLIKKSMIFNQIDLVIDAIQIFFDAVKLCSQNETKQSGSVPSKFVYFVNNHNDVSYILEYLEKARIQMVNIADTHYHCNNAFRNYRSILNKKIFACFNCKMGERIKYVYNHIRKYSLKINSQYWIMVDCKDIKYYNLKNIHEISFEN